MLPRRARRLKLRSELDRSRATAPKRLSKHRNNQRKRISLDKAQDLWLQTIRELRRHYHKKHPIILDEIASGKLKATLESVGLRIGCGKLVWSKYLLENPDIKSEIQAAKKHGPIGEYDLAEVLTGIPSGVDSL